LQMLPVVAYDEIVLGTEVVSVATIGDPPAESLTAANQAEMATAQ